MGSLNVKRGNVQVDYGSFVLYNGVSKWTTSFDTNSGYKISYASNTRYLKIDSSGNLNVVDTIGSPRIVVRTESPTANSFPGFAAYNFQNGFVNGYPVVELVQSRGTVTNPTAVQIGDVLGSFNAWGYNGSVNRSGMRFTSYANDNWTSTTGTAYARMVFPDGVNDYPCALFSATVTESRIEIGAGRGPAETTIAYLDFVGDNTYSDYGLRIIRGDGGTGANCPSSITHRGTGNFTIGATEGATIFFKTTNVVRGGWEPGGNFFLGSTTDTLTRTLGVTGTAQITTSLRVGDAVTGNIDATLMLNSAQGGFGRFTQIGGGTNSCLNLMWGANYFSWGVDNSVWRINAGTTFGTTGFNMNQSNEVGIGGAPVAGYKLYSYGNMVSKLDQNARTFFQVDNQSNTASAYSEVTVTCAGGGYSSFLLAPTVNTLGGYWTGFNQAGYASNSVAGIGLVANAATGAVDVLTGGGAVSNIRARWSAAGNLALGYGARTDATEKVQLKNGNIWLNGVNGTHGLIFPNGSKQLVAAATAITGLSDVVITTPADGHILTWDTTTSKWINESLPSYTTSFTNASLAAGILTVTHSLGSKFCVVQVYDNTDKVIIPDEITGTSTTVTTIDLSSFGVITGTWNVRVVK